MTNDLEALAAKLKKTESDLVKIGWLEDADNVREAVTALRAQDAAPAEYAKMSFFEDDDPAPQAVAADGEDEDAATGCADDFLPGSAEDWRDVLRNNQDARPTATNGDKDAVIGEAYEALTDIAAASECEQSRRVASEACANIDKALANRGEAE